MQVTLASISMPVVEGVHTPEDFVAYAARVSNPDNQMNTATTPKLLAYLVRNRHWSPFEMVSLVMEINTTRDIARQILRHRSFSFQEFCVSGDTKISLGLVSSGKKVRMQISDMYDKYISGDLLHRYVIRSYNTDSNKIEYFNIKEVFKTGIKEVWEIKLDNGKSVKCTKDHKFHLKTGFKPLKDIKEGDFIAHNGTPVYQDKEWLAQAKIRSIENKRGVQGIADEAACSYHTIRKWLKVHGLTFSKKEVSSYTTVWNKGLPAEQQPMYGKPHSSETREKMRASSIKGEDSNLFISGGYAQGKLPFRRRVAQVSKGSLNTLRIRQNYRCAICGRDITKVDDVNLGVEVDHIKPVSLYPESAFDENNMQAVCLDPCHSAKSAKETEEANETVLYSRVASITYIGEEDTFDIEVDHTSHNYIANGIVSHNSQRYASVESLGFSVRECRLQDNKNRQNSIEVEDRELANMWEDKQLELLVHVKALYKWALDNGIAKEVARAVLPEGMTGSRLYMSGTLRSWIHYIQERTYVGTQKEHRCLGEQAKTVVTDLFPSISEILDANTAK